MLASYPNGHHQAVLTSHLSRTAQNSAAHLLPLLEPGMRLLDIGCGPGTITTSLAELVRPGQVIGLDPEESVVQSAKQLAGDAHPNVRFQPGDGANLPFEDGSFDIVHCHQVLQHTAQTVEMLREMRRVCKKPGGIISLREADATSISLWPPLPQIQTDFVELYPKVASYGGADPQTGRKLHILLRKAGFSPDEVEITAGCHLYGVNNAKEAAWWGDSWAQRVSAEDSGFCKTALQAGLASQEQLNAIADAWFRWGRSEDAWFAMINGQAICRMSSSS